MSSPAPEEMDFEVIAVGAAPVIEAATAPEIAADGSVKSEYVPRKAGKLTKDFCLSSNILSVAFTAEQITKILNPGLKKAQNDFVMVEPEAESSPFVTAAIKESQRSLTENAGPTFSTSGDARVDFFFHVMEQTTSEDTLRLLKASWETDDLETLKLVASLRDIQLGKGIRGQYQHCLYWMYENHPRTLYENLPILLQFGYWKDALQLLVVAAFNGFVHPYFQDDDGVKSGAHHAGLALNFGHSKRKASKRKSLRQQRDINNREYNERVMLWANAKGEPNRTEMQQLRLRYARHRYNDSKKYQLFHTRVAQLFAEQLAKDLKEYQKEPSTEKKEVSLAAKWAPTLEGHFDRFTLIASSIAVELAKILGKTDIFTKSIPVAVYLARKMYNKEVCIPLRKFCEIPEIRMSNGEWDQVNYKRVPAKCMKKNKLHFIRHDKERLEAYLKKDDSKVAGATLKPIEIIKEAMSITRGGTEEAEKTIIEKQWISLADDIKAKGGALLKDAIAVCDVSGSMQGDPMTAAIGLTLLTMNMTATPWNSMCITFHQNPKIFNLKPSLTLLEKVESLRAMEWGGTTNFQGVFQEILRIGTSNKLKPDQMPKVLFVYTDMEFNAAFPNTAQTNFEAAKDMFKEKGYDLPVMVFWNLRSAGGKSSTPVQVDENGTILLSGWSGQLLAFVMSQENLKDVSPWQFVKQIVDNEKYNGLKIYD